MSNTLQNGKTIVHLDIQIQNNGKSAILKINNKDYPIAIDLENEELKLYVWDSPHISKATSSYDLTPYLKLE